MRGLCTEGNLRFKIDWARLIFGKKFTVFLFFTLYYRTISKYKPPPPVGGGSLCLEGRFKGRFFALRVWGGLYLEYIFGGLIHGGAYFRNFTVKRKHLRICVKEMQNILKIFLKG